MPRLPVSSPRIPSAIALRGGVPLDLDIGKLEILVILNQAKRAVSIAGLAPGRVTRLDNIKWLISQGICYEHAGCLWLSPGVEIQ